MRHRNFLVILLICTGLLAMVQPVRADTMDGITFTLTFPNLSGSPGNTLTWDYTVTDNNSVGLNVFALSVNETALFNGGAPDQAVFDNFGGTNIVSSGATLTGTLFSFLSDPTVPNSTNAGSFLLTVILQDSQGHFVGMPFDLTEKYSATITSAANVPEPGTLMLLASGLLAGLLISRRAAH